MLDNIVAPIKRFLEKHHLNAELRKLRENGELDKMLTTNYYQAIKVRTSSISVAKAMWHRTLFFFPPLPAIKTKLIGESCSFIRETLVGICSVEMS